MAALSGQTSDLNLIDKIIADAITDKGEIDLNAFLEASGVNMEDITEAFGEDAELIKQQLETTINKFIKQKTLLIQGVANKLSEGGLSR
jgi:hypothetical protein